MASAFGTPCVSPVRNDPRKKFYSVLAQAQQAQSGELSTEELALENISVIPHHMDQSNRRRSLLLPE